MRNLLIELLAESTGTSVESWVEANERSKKPKFSPEEALKKQEEARRKQEEEYREELTREYPVDEVVKATKTNLNKLIRWSSSRYQRPRKKDVIDKIIEALKKGDDCVLEFSCGAYTETADIHGWGRDYKLVIYNGIAKLIVKGITTKVYELRK